MFWRVPRPSCSIHPTGQKHLALALCQPYPMLRRTPLSKHIIREKGTSYQPVPRIISHKKIQPDVQPRSHSRRGAQVVWAVFQNILPAGFPWRSNAWPHADSRKSKPRPETSGWIAWSDALRDVCNTSRYVTLKYQLALHQKLRNWLVTLSVKCHPSELRHHLLINLLKRNSRLPCDLNKHSTVWQTPIC